VLVAGDVVVGHPFRLEATESVGDGGKRRSGTDGRRGLALAWGWVVGWSGGKGSKVDKLELVGLLSPLRYIFVSRERLYFKRWLRGNGA
jgi:hypothetical protein